MSRTAKNPVTLARAALKLGKQALADYSHPKSPQKFTQPQLFAMLVLKQFFKLDYRGTAEYIRERPKLQNVLELKRIPHYSTLCYAEARLLKKEALIGSLMQLALWPAAGSRRRGSPRTVGRAPLGAGTCAGLSGTAIFGYKASDASALLIPSCLKKNTQRNRNSTMRQLFALASKAGAPSGEGRKTLALGNG